MINTYFIGGSPCSGKSTVAEILAEKYKLYYFKVDDFLDDFLARGVASRKKVSMKINGLTAEQTWMRDPNVQQLEELEYLGEIIEFIMEDLHKISEVEGIITEGAAYLPELMKSMYIPEDKYICITPTKEFQVEHYKKRPWVPYILEDCSDKEKAFENWMERDALFAESVRMQCKEAGYESIVIDGKVEVQKIVQKVSELFRLEE